MNYDLSDAMDILSRTPRTLDGWLRDLPEAWTSANEGEGSWSPFDIMAHLIHGDRTDWIPRARHILSVGDSEPFEPFDFEGQIEEGRGREMNELLDLFAGLREEGLTALREIQPDDAMLGQVGMHPSLGQVTLRQLLSTWVVHDLSHLAQIARVMAKQYAAEMGPWPAFFPILKDRKS